MDDQPPMPVFWMHQLYPETGADQRFCLNPTVSLGKVADLLRYQPATCRPAPALLADVLRVSAVILPGRKVRAAIAGHGRGRLGDQVHEHAQIEGLANDRRDEVRVELVNVAGIRGDHDDGWPALETAQRGDHFPAVDARERQIEQQNVVFLLGEQSKSVGTILGGVNSESAAGDDELKKAGDA